MELGERMLVWRLRRRDPGACRELIRRHHPVVYGHLRRLGADPALAEDLTQETYARAWRGIDDLRKAASLRSWLLTIARNEFLQVVRSRNPEVTTLDALPQTPTVGPPADEPAARAERDVELRRAVHRLDPPLQQTVALHYFQELSLREVAEVLGLPRGTIKSRLNRALDTLRRRLEGKETDDEQDATRETAAGRS